MAQTLAAQRILHGLPRSAYKVTSYPKVSWDFFGPVRSSVYRPYLWDDAARVYLTEQGKQVALLRPADGHAQGSYGQALQISPAIGDVQDYGITIPQDLGSRWAFSSVFRENWDIQPAAASEVALLHHAGGPRMVYDEKEGKVRVSGFRDEHLRAALNMDETGGYGAEMGANISFEEWLIPWTAAEGGFEQYAVSPGAPDGWIIMAGDAAAYTRETGIVFEGLNSLKIQIATATDHRVYRNFVAVAGATYRFTLRARKAAANAGTVQFRIRDDAGTLVQTMANMNADPSDTWVQKSFTWTATAAGTFRFSLELIGTAIGDIAYFDASETYSLPGWVQSTSIISRESVIKRSGAYSLKRVAVAGGGVQGVQYMISTVGNKSYYWEVWARTGGNPAHRAQAKIHNVTDAASLGDMSTSLGTTEWTKLFGTFRAKVGHTYRLELFGTFPAIDGEVTYFDDISIKEIYAKDESGYGNHFTFAANQAGSQNAYGPTIDVPGKIGRAIRFDNNGDFLHHPSFDYGIMRQGNELGKFAFEVWVRRIGTVSTGERILIGRNGFHGGILQYTGSSSREFRFKIADMNGATVQTGSAVVPDDGGWHQLFAVYDAGAMVLYLDGAPAGTATYNTAIPFRAYATSLYIGGTDSSTNWTVNAETDLVRVYSRAPSAAEVSAHYNAGLARRADSLLEHSLGWAERDLHAVTLKINVGKSVLYVDGAERDSIPVELGFAANETAKLRRTATDPTYTGTTSQEAWFFHNDITAEEIASLHRMFTTGFTEESRWVRHAMALAMVFGEVESLGWNLHVMTHIDSAVGGALTLVGKDFNVPRRAGEVDEVFRGRIKNRLLEIFADGSINQLIRIAAARTGLTKQEITLRNLSDENGNFAPMQFMVQIPPGNEDLLLDLLDAMQAAALAGVQAHVGSVGSFAWDTAGAGWDLGGWNYVR